MDYHEILMRTLIKTVTVFFTSKVGSLQFLCTVGLSKIQVHVTFHKRKIFRPIGYVVDI